MTFPEWLDSREGQDAFSDAIFGDKGQRMKALEKAWLAGKWWNKPPLVDPEPADDLELSMADLPEGAWTS